MASPFSQSKEASDRKLDIADFTLLRYYVAFLRGDQAAMAREAARAKGKPGVEDLMTHSEALVLARSGQLRLAKIMAQHAIDLAQQEGQRERAATYRAAVAVWEALYGDAPAAKASAIEALEFWKGGDVEFAATFALTLAGDRGRSDALANDLDQRFPEDTCVRFNYLPTLHALAAIKRGEPGTALEALQPATANELGVPALAFNGLYGALYPVYMRGEAFRAAHRGAEAATEFQKVLDHRGLVGADPIGGLAHLQIGRALALSGETTKARHAYQEFLTLWKDADASILILNEAKTEYAKLR